MELSDASWLIRAVKQNLLSEDQLVLLLGELRRDPAAPAREVVVRLGLAALVEPRPGDREGEAPAEPPPPQPARAPTTASPSAPSPATSREAANGEHTPRPLPTPEGEEHWPATSPYLDGKPDQKEDWPATSPSPDRTPESDEAWPATSPSLCRSPDELQQFVQHARPPEEVDELASHLAQCSRCASLVDGLLTGISAAQALGAQSGAPPTVPGVIQQLVSRARALASSASAGGLSPTSTLDLPRYQRLRAVARGGLGQVWLANDQHLGRDVAVKEMLPQAQQSPQAVDRFVREAQITGQLAHPGIVPIYELSRNEDGSLFYAMKLLKGRTYNEAIVEYHRLPANDPQRNLKLNELLTIFVGICNAVGFAHNQGVIHRDLKPLNVMLGDFGEAIVVDWGLARLFTSKEPRTLEEILAADTAQNGVAGPAGQGTRTGSVLGTPAFMSPEQARGEHSSLDGRSDIYSLGSILYTVLAGRVAYPGKTARAIVTRVEKGDFEPLRAQSPHVPRPLEAVCLRAMAFRKEDRYGTARELGEEVTRWLAGEPVRAYPEPWWQRAGRYARRHRTFCLSGAAALVVTLLALGAWQWRERQRTEAVRVEARQLFDEGKQALRDGDAGTARIHLSSALAHLKGVPALRELHADVIALQEEAEAEAQKQQHRAEVALVQKRRAEFDGHRDDAFFHGIDFIGLDVASNRDAVGKSAAAALALFPSLWQEGSADPVLDRALPPAQREELQRRCREMLLLQALNLADKAARERALNLLDQAWEKEKAEQARKGAGPAASEVALDAFLLGGKAFYRQNHAAALDHFLNALHREPDHFGALFYAAVCQLALERPDQAVATLTACLSRRPDLSWIFIFRGYAYGKQKQPELVKLSDRDFVRAEQLGLEAPQEYTLLLARADVRQLQGRLDEAVADIEKAIKLRPQKFQAYLLLGKVQRERKDLQAAREALDRAVELLPRSPQPYSERARVHKQAKNPQEALKDLDRAVALYSGPIRERAEDQINRALLLFHAKRFDEGLAAAELALKDQPGLGAALRLRAECLLGLERDKEAITAFGAYLKHGPAVADVYQARGTARAKTGDYAGAMEDYTRALELQPGVPNMHSRRGWAYLLSASKLALKDFDAALRANPKDPDAYNGRGYALVQLGEYGPAVADAEKAVTLGAKMPGFLVNAACIYAQALLPLARDAGQPERERLTQKFQERAVALLRSALDLVPAEQRERFLKQAILADPALEPLYGLPGFKRLAAGKE